MIWPMMLCAHNRVVSCAGGQIDDLAHHFQHALVDRPRNILQEKPLHRRGGLIHFVQHDADLLIGQVAAADALEARVNHGAQHLFRRKILDEDVLQCLQVRRLDGPLQHLRVQPHLVAEVIVHRGHVAARLGADVADRRRMVAAFGEDTAADFEQFISRPVGPGNLGCA